MATSDQAWRSHGDRRRAPGRRARARAVILMALGWAVIGCGSSGATTPTATPGVSQGPTPTPTAVPTATPAPTPTPVSVPTPIPFTLDAIATGTLAAGTYEFAGPPSAVFTVDDGWMGILPEPAAMVLEQGSTSISLGPVTQVYTACCVPDQELSPVAAGADPTAVANQMAGVAGIHLSPLEPISIGGASGVRFDVTTDQSTYGFIVGDHQGYAFPPDDEEAVIFVSVRGTLVAIVVEDLTEQFDAAVTLAQPILDSLQFPA